MDRESCSTFRPLPEDDKVAHNQLTGSCTQVHIHGLPTPSSLIKETGLVGWTDFALTEMDYIKWFGGKTNKQAHNQPTNQKKKKVS